MGAIIMLSLNEHVSSTDHTECLQLLMCFRYLGGAFDVETLVENLLHGFPGSEMIAVNVYDITNELCPLVMYGHTNVSKSENTYVSSLDFGDPQRKHEMRCRYNEDALPPWTAISTSVGIFVIGFLVGHMLHASRNRIDKVEENCRMFKELKVLADEASVAKSQVGKMNK
jgi:histidine kinase 2/3/4 (cytokinin receptor)